MGEGGPDVAEIARRQFDTACRLSGRNNSGLAIIIGAAIHRPRLTRQTVVKWRSGGAPIPCAATLAVYALLDVDELAYTFEVLKSNLQQIRDGFKHLA